jgi:hypothetical protein
VDGDGDFSVLTDLDPGTYPVANDLLEPANRRLDNARRHNAVRIAKAE